MYTKLCISLQDLRIRSGDLSLKEVFNQAPIMLQLKKLEHSNLSEKVRMRLKQLIVNHNLKPGTRLKEDEIADELEVSRTPVREALLALAQDGLVTFIPRKGAYVIEITRKDVEEIYAIREVLEGLAVKLACPFLTDKELQTLANDHLEAAERLKKNDFHFFVEIDTQFHDLIVEKSGNGRLHNLLQTIHDQILIFRTWEAEKYHDNILNALDEHKSILEGLISRREDETEKRMREHVKRVKQSILANYPF